MKVFVIVALLAVVAAEPIIRTFTLRELSTALETNQVDPKDLSAFKYALNKIMAVIFSGKNQERVQAAIQSPSGALEWTITEMNQTLLDPTTEQQKYVFVKMARDTIIQMNESGMNRKTMAITLPAMDISTWTQEDLFEAIDNPNTIPALRRRLKKALSDLGTANTIQLVTAVGLIPNNNPRFLPAPKVKADSQKK